MSDPSAPNGLPEEPADIPAGPHRVIGTPSPAEARTLLGERAGEEAGSRPAPQELPTDPPDLDKAKSAERLVAACFILSMLAGIGFIAAYIGLEVHSVDAVLRSNLALGLSMSVAFLGLAVGATIWVRHLMPNVEITEERHPMASSPADRKAFAETFAEGAEASQFVKRPLLRRTLIAATVPLVAAPVVLLRDMGPLPGTTLRHTVWRKGLRLLTYGENTPITPGDFSSPGSMITVIPEGYQDDTDALASASSWPTPRSAPTWAARWRCTSRPPATSCARVTSRRSTRRVAPRCSSARRPGRCRSCRSPRTRRATWSRGATSTNRSARVSGSEDDYRARA
jgi:ubiquinol-cytochrome c reductase iron-sulfur subunit